MKIHINTIPHSLQRYNTCGDWYTDKRTGKVDIFVSECGNWKYELLIAIHELVEAFLCLSDGVTEESVDKFDKQFVGNYEPGDDVNSPYRKQHCLATGVERILAACLGVDWATYEQTLDNLFKSREKEETGESLSKA